MWSFQLPADLCEADPLMVQLSAELWEADLTELPISKDGLTGLGRGTLTGSNPTQLTGWTGMLVSATSL